MSLSTRQSTLSNVAERIRQQNANRAVECTAENIVSQIRDIALELTQRERMSFIAAIQEECESIANSIEL